MRGKHKLDTHRPFWEQTPVRRILLSLAAWIALSVPALSQTAEIDSSEPLVKLSARDAIILGLVEGVTEFLPISSTGHLIIATHALKLESETPLMDANGEPLWHKPPSAKHPEGVPVTVKLAADTYTVVIQAGAIAAVVLIFWGRLTGILQGLVGKNSAGLRLLRNIIVACIPAVVIG
ncbi:MAG: undecaprenyl-diphosphate phosphatase, partial [Rariglobus sp.]